MTYTEARRAYLNSLEAGQDRRSVLDDMRAMGLTDTQVWAIANRNPKHF